MNGLGGLYRAWRGRQTRYILCLPAAVLRYRDGLRYDNRLSPRRRWGLPETTDKTPYARSILRIRSRLEHCSSVGLLKVSEGLRSEEPYIVVRIVQRLAQCGHSVPVPEVAESIGS